MNDSYSLREPIAIFCGSFCLLVGLAQFLYSFLAFVSIIFVDMLGIGLTFASAALAAFPDEPYVIPYARALAKAIAVFGMLFSVTVFVAGSRCFYRKKISSIDSCICLSLCLILAILHFTNSIGYVGAIYVGLAIAIGALLLVDCRVAIAQASPSGAPPIVPENPQTSESSPDSRVRSASS